MDNIWERAKSVLAGNLNSSLSYLITTVPIRITLKKDVSKIDGFFSLKSMIDCIKRLFSITQLHEFTIPCFP